MVGKGLSLTNQCCYDHRLPYEFISSLGIDFLKKFPTKLHSRCNYLNLLHNSLLLSLPHIDQDLGGYPPLIRDSIFPPGGQVKGEGGLCADDDASDSTLMIGAGGGGSATGTSISQQLKWQAHMVESWHEICDGALQDM